MLQGTDRGLRGSVDWTLIAIYLLLVFIGWLNVYASIHTPDMGSPLDFSLRSGKQFVWILTAFALALTILFAINPRLWEVLATPGYLIVLVLLFYFFARYEEFHRAAFIVLASFFLYYVIFIFVPVVGPTFYFNAVGVDQIAKGVFPDLGLYFNNHQECLPSPGDVNGVFYQLVESAKEAGERPTAAFPSSHVGCSTVLMLLALHTKKRWLVWLLLPLYVLLCFATVYIQAHYAIDAIAGFITAVVFYLVLMYVSKRLKI